MTIVAIPKGRLMPLCLDKLAKLGILDAYDFKERQLSYDLGNGITLFIVRNSDILTYIKNNMADIAFIGSDLLLEDGDNGNNYYDYADADLGRCRLMVAGLSNKGDKANKGGKVKNSASNKAVSNKLRVATKYTNVATNYYASKGLQAEIIKINGSVELAASAGFVDQIVDIVDTGKTLKDNNLVQLDKIADVTTRIIANKGVMKSKWETISPLLDKLAAAETK